MKVDRDRKLLNADITWTNQFDRKSVEPVQNHVNKCEQRIIPEFNTIILLKLRHEWHTTMTFWARRNLRRGRWLKMAEILTLKRNCNPRQSRDRSCDVRSFQFAPSRLRIWINLDYFPISVISDIFRDYYGEFWVTLF